MFDQHIADASLDDFDPLRATPGQFPVLRQLERKLRQNPAQHKYIKEDKYANRQQNEKLTLQK